MRTADINGDLIECYHVSEFPYIQIQEKYINCKYTKKPKKYLKAFMTFDIETSNITDIINGEKNHFAFMYHWQMCIDGICVYGRFWREWADLLCKISNWLELDPIDKRMVIYVHNLGFEFQFMRDFLNEYFEGFEIFAAQKRKPIYVLTGNGFEFRCSYKLTNMSLEMALKNEKGIKHFKQVGDLDYSIIRTPNTEINDKEFSYNIGDVLSLWELITCRLKNEHDNIETIPLTSTSYVRRDCRRATRKESGYRDLFNKNALNREVYTLLKEAGRGGNTHANRYFSGRIWENVSSYDVVSSYPFQMLAHEYPMRSFTYYGEIDNIEELNGLIDNKPCLFRIVFYNIRLRDEIAMPYISTSKAIGRGIEARFDNGRILSADALALTITDIDYKIIRDQYKWEEFSISDFYFSKYEKLPESLRGQIMEYYNRKTVLKDEIEKEKDPEKKKDLKYNYAKSKNRLNGIFGMCYTDPVRTEIKIDDLGNWIEEKPNISEKLDKYNNGRNSFLVYAWGIWVTCWARLWLENLLTATNKNGNLAIYCDTDSSKAVINDSTPIDQMNDDIKQICEDKKLYCEIDHKKYYLGLYELENEKPYKSFKTLGAKKYVYEDKNGLHITIAGVNKKLGASELGSINNFKPGFIFKDAGGTELYYNDENKIYTIKYNGEEIETASNVAIVDGTYTIGITNEYAELIGFNNLE